MRLLSSAFLIHEPLQGEWVIELTSSWYCWCRLKIVHIMSRIATGMIFHWCKNSAVGLGMTSLSPTKLSQDPEEYVNGRNKIHSMGARHPVSSFPFDINISRNVLRGIFVAFLTLWRSRD